MGQTMLDLLFIEPSRTYVGFEPNPVCAGYLSQLVAENEFSNLTVIASALGQEATLRARHLQRGRVIDDAATLVTEVRPNRAYFEQLVPTWPLDNIYHKCSAESPAVVVVDVEGAELEVLRGMAELLKSERPPVVCEVLFTDKRADLSFMKFRNDEMAALLNEIKYAIFQIVKTHGTASISHLRMLQTLPNEYYDDDNKHYCDYLFAPVEMIGPLSSVFDCLE